MKRHIFLIMIIVAVAPIIVSAATHPPRATATVDQSPTEVSSVTFVATQGREAFAGGSSQVVAVETDTKDVIWRDARYDTYYDIDPLNESTVLYLGNNGSRGTAVIENWRTGEVIQSVPLGNASHDVDYLGDNRFVYVDGVNHEVVVYNATTEEKTWVYDFTEHFPPDVGGGGPGYSGDYTHLNDVDVVNNGSHFLVSPRNFDRVMLINRSTKEVTWTLGEEDNHSILFEQHNPMLVSQDPRTILVADSDNDRVLEYQYRNGNWTLVWGYQEDLQWPRDADRLPNGNTLIVDSEGQRVIEVTPEREIVWEFRITKSPYDVERWPGGDEPGGPPMSAVNASYGEPLPPESSSWLTKTTDIMTEAYTQSQWLLPWWVGKLDLASLLAGFVIAGLWLSDEFARAKPRLVGRHLDQLLLPGSFVGLGILIAGGLVYYGLLPAFMSTGGTDDIEPLLVGMAVLLGSQAMALSSVLLDTLSERRVPHSVHWTALGIAALCCFGFAGVALKFYLADVPGTLEYLTLLVGTGIAGVAITSEILRVVDRWRFDGTPAAVFYIAGAAVLVAGISILVIGLQQSWLPGVYLAFGTYAALAGESMMARTEAQLGRLANSVVRPRYLGRLVWVALAIGLGVTSLGAGAIAGVTTINIADIGAITAITLQWVYLTARHRS